MPYFMLSKRGVHGVECFMIFPIGQPCIVILTASAASVSEKEGSMLLLQYITQTPYLRCLCSHIKRVWADGGYRGEELINWVKELWSWLWTIVLRTDNQKGFKVIPRRWVVECTFA